MSKKMVLLNFIFFLDRLYTFLLIHSFLCQMCVVVYSFIMLLVVGAHYVVFHKAHLVCQWTDKVLALLLVFIVLLPVVGVHHVFIEVHCVSVSVHDVVFAHHVLFQVSPLWLVLPVPLHCPTSWSFIGGGSLVVARFWQKLLHFKYVHFFSKLVWVVFIFFYCIDDNVLIICLPFFFCMDNFQIENIVYNFNFYLLLLKGILKQFCKWQHFICIMFSWKMSQLVNSLCAFSLFAKLKII